MINIYEVLKNFPNLSKQLHCKGLLFTNYDCPQSEGKEQFFLEYNLILYVISGRRFVHKHQNKWELKEGTCAFVKKGTHVAERQGDDGWCVMAFFMPDGFLKNLVNENRNNLPLANLAEAGFDHLLPLEVNDLSKSFFFSMLPYFLQAPPPPENLLELKFKELILSLLSNKMNSRFLSYLNNLTNQTSPSIEDIMQNNFTFNLTLSDYAKLACKSVPTFNREFKKIFNASPAKWIVKKRLALARELLENSSNSIAEIGYECGFQNQAHFSRVFKDKMGVSPLQFRMNLQPVQISQ